MEPKGGAEDVGMREGGGENDNVGQEAQMAGDLSKGDGMARREFR